MTAMIAECPESTGSMEIEACPDGRHRVSVVPAPGHTVSKRSWVTCYPVSLIREIHRRANLYVCDEIMREEDPNYVEHSLRKAVLGYLEPAAFAGKRVLDFGCGSGASCVVLHRLLPSCELVGIELESRLLEVARLRAQHFGLKSLQLLQSPRGDRLPDGIGRFDFIMFNAVFEHLLPHERRTLLPEVWRHLRPGGVLLLNQTPYRYSPLELHTTNGMPFINYLPDWLTHWAVRKFCGHVPRTDDWQALLRRGIRGGTVPEIIQILGGRKHVELLRPLPAIGDRIDLWYSTLSSRHAGLKRTVWAALKMLKAMSGREITPELSLAIRRRD